MPYWKNRVGADGANVTNLFLTSGETLAGAITLAVAGVAWNITGYSLKMQVNLPTPLLLNTSNGGITITDAVNGKIQINITSTVTAIFPVGVYPYDLWAVNAGVETLILSGFFNVSSNITPVP